jgi:dipeptidyl aminopeptidase/acylaminoacyl peptidase
VTAWGDLQAFQDLPRLAGLAVSPDGARLVTTVATPDPKRTRFRTALWEIDPAGERPARRLTRGTGESGQAFLPDGDLLFTSARPDPDEAEPADDTPAALWRLPPAGEAHVVGSRAGGIGPPVVARAAGTVVVGAKTLPGAVTDEDDAARRAARKARKIGAVLHAAHPVRYWDSDLGPDEERLLAGTVPADGVITWCDLTPTPARALGAFAVTPDGAAVVAEWEVPERHGGSRTTLVVVDVASGERRTLLDDPAADFGAPTISPDGTRLACVRETRSTATAPIDRTLLVVPLPGGAPQEVAPHWDRWPEELCWVGDALHVTADDAGRRPVFRVTPDSANPVRLTGDDGCYGDLVAAPDGSALYALRSAIDAPPAPVRLDPAAPDQRPVPLPGPAERPELPGTLTAVTATAADGTPLRAWLALPDGDGRAPLLLWIHGGPLGSWNAWQWRWNPWLMTARGYAVLLPDPALSTGYGRAFVARGWGAWGDAPYTDLMALTDAAVAHPRVDADAVAAMGGSFGGYMANWVAGHTDRFRAIVTHASLWALDGFGRTTDDPAYWRRELTPEMAARHSPHRHVDAITTPILVVHGDKDYRVPIGEGLALWWDLVAAWDGDPAEIPHRFLYFPDENHWILKPQHAVLWYETVLAFLDHHVRGRDWVVPELLR